MTDFPFWISESRTSISEPVKLFSLRLDAILMTQRSTLPGTGERKRSLIWYYFGCGVCKFSILLHMHLNTHGGQGIHHVYAGRLHAFPKLRVFVESDVVCLYETFIRKTGEKFRIRIRNCSCMRLIVFKHICGQTGDPLNIFAPQKLRLSWRLLLFLIIVTITCLKKHNYCLSFTSLFGLHCSRPNFLKNVLEVLKLKK